MSRRRHRTRLPHSDRRRVRPVDVAARYACTSDADYGDLQSAKRRSAALLAGAVVGRRRGEITHYVVIGDQIDAFLDEAEALDDDGTDGTVDYDQLRAWFAENPNGRLVVATCKAVRP